MNNALQKLQPYPFEKLGKLFADVSPANIPPISLSVGEPKHAAPEHVLNALIENIRGVENYPSTKGSQELRQSIKTWLDNRFGLPDHILDAERNILPVNGTREALFAFAQTVVEGGANALVLSPNPFYQIYEGAAYLAGAQPYYYPLDSNNGYQPNFDDISDDVWQRCELLYICTPGNPTGAVIPEADLHKLINKAIEFDFVIASDECYSEIYFDKKPVGLLQAAMSMGHDNLKNCVVFHSLSKRSNLPGLRSGFVAGDGEILAKFFQYRTYHGCAMPPATQAASIAAWSDEHHVQANRDEYTKKFDAVVDILAPVLPVVKPDASFYLWPKVAINDMDDTQFAQQLLSKTNIKVLPGSYLSREFNGVNPGKNHIRMALVAELEQCIEGANRMRHFMESIL